MKIENQKTSEEAVMTAMAKFLSDLWFEDDFRDQPEYLSEIFETILINEMGNDQDLRIKMVSSIRTSKLLANTLGPFSDKEIKNDLHENHEFIIPHKNKFKVFNLCL